MKKTVSAQVPKRKFKNQDELFVFLVLGVSWYVRFHDGGGFLRRPRPSIGDQLFRRGPQLFDGEAEIKLGNALRPYRDRVF